MTTWRKVLSWETVPEGHDYASEDVRAQALNQELERLKQAGDESVHTFTVWWSGYASGHSTVLGRNMEEAKLLQEYGLDYDFETDDTNDWESHGIRDDETDEQEDW